jgi:hypothetical protein
MGLQQMLELLIKMKAYRQADRERMETKMEAIQTKLDAS